MVKGTLFENIEAKFSNLVSSLLKEPKYLILMHEIELLSGELNVLIAPTAVSPQERLGVSELVYEVVHVQTFKNHFEHLLILTKSILS